MKTTFYVTESAGGDVAGQTSPGFGGTMLLTESQAAHSLRIGHLSRSPVNAPAVEPAKGFRAARGTKRRSF